MLTSEKQITAPGISMAEVLKNLSQHTLFEILGSSIVNLIKVLEPSALTGDKLGQFASKFIDSKEIILDSQKLYKILDSIPYVKKKELAVRLGIDEQEVNLCDLHARASHPKVFSIVSSFFGINNEEKIATIMPPDTKTVKSKYSLFEHQREVVGKVLSSFENSTKKIILHMPTGAGKTRSAMHIVSTHLRKNEKTVVVWLAQNAELLEQAAEEFELSWQFLGNRSVELVRFWGNHDPSFDNLFDGIIVAGLAKMTAFDKKNPSMMLRLADRTMLTVIDEAHQAIAPTYASVIDTLFHKRPRNKLLGLTATPGRSWLNVNEDIELSNFFDKQKISLSIEGYANPIKFLIEKKFLARPIFKQLIVNPKLDISDRELFVGATDMDIPEIVMMKLGQDVERNCQIVKAVEELLTRHNRIIVFAPSVENAKLLFAILTMKNHEAHLILGESNAMARDRIIKRFKSSVSKSMILVNYGVLTTGFDSPNISAAVIARPTKSLVLYSQMVGRATRGTKAGGNDVAEIVTIVDTNLPGFGSMEEFFTFWENIWETEK